MEVVSRYARIVVQRGQRPRMALAVFISLCVHGLIIGGWSGSGGLLKGSSASSRYRWDQHTGISANLQSAMDAPLVSTTRTVNRPGVTPAGSDQPPAVQGIAGHPAAEAGQRFYSARELDLYPVPTSPLQIADPDNGGISGHARLLLRIDHIGRVVDIAVIAADPPGVFGSEARTSLLRTRFMPARKDGRPVNSRVVMEVHNP